MSAREPDDSILLCYCTNLSVGELRTGCVGDLLYCLKRFGVAPTVRLTIDD